MKLMTENSMVSILEATREDRKQLRDRMAPLPDCQDSEWGLMDIPGGRYRVMTIVRDGEKIGAFWYWFDSTTRTLVINWGAVFKKQFNSVPDFMTAYTILAKQLGAVQIETMTQQEAVVRRYRAAGWRVAGVALRFFCE